MTAFFIILGIVLFLFALWMFLIAPGKSCGMEKFKHVKYAHRGLHGTNEDGAFAAENSLTAFERAASLGFGIELDVRVTKDKEVVVFHDGTLDRVTNGTGKVCEHTLAELRELSLMGTEDTVPTFREVLDLVDGRVPLLVELKEDGMDHSVGDLAAKMLAEYKGDYIVESFSPLAFGTVRAVLPDAKCGFLVDKHTAYPHGRTFKHRLAQSFMLNVIARPAFIAINAKWPRLFPLPLIRALFHTPVIAWTVKSEEEEIAAYKNGIDGIIFEGYIPDELLSPTAKK